jgi:hypothetical protein
VIIAVELGIDHWFYLYIPWFFGLVIVALLGRYAAPAKRPASGLQAVSGPATEWRENAPPAPAVGVAGGHTAWTAGSARP